jgi:PIN domain nuclease of toxin-antitoxin system
MRYLLDTHTFLWAYARSKQLPESVRLTIQDSENEVFVSAVTFWEIAIKLRAKRLHVGGKTALDLIDEASKMNFRLISLESEEAASHQHLTEDTHFDPFDRMLIWQAIGRKLVLISSDPAFDRFKQDGLKLIWK